jgi:hypothetical protein
MSSPNFEISYQRSDRGRTQTKIGSRGDRAPTGNHTFTPKKGVKSESEELGNNDIRERPRMTAVDTQGFTRMVRPKKQKWERNSIAKSMIQNQFPTAMSRSMLESTSCFMNQFSAQGVHREWTWVFTSPQNLIVVEVERVPQCMDFRGTLDVEKGHTWSINTDSTAVHEATYRHCGKDPP